MKKLIFLFVITLIVSCSNDTDDIKDDNINSAPSITSQQFQIAEHAPTGTVIGTIQASDSNNDELSYTLESTQDILINETTGELSIGDGLKLDYETGTTLNFTVSVFDGATISDADISLTISNINEFDVLNESQKELVEHFKHLTLFQDPTSSTQDVMRKWDEPMKLYLVGNFPQATRTMVEEVIANYNMLTASGNFNISLVATESESSAQLFFGTKAETENVFPNMYEQIKDLTLDGYAISSFSGNSYRSAEIWISSQTGALFTHEMGHALGIGHSNLCAGGNPSAMCSTISPNNQLLGIEQNVISYFYNEDMPTGLNEQQIEHSLSNLILMEE
ncbi:MAG: hypothetical protein ACJART_001821 [Maribacter sp.]|jgi:hypothetical protein